MGWWGEEHPSIFIDDKNDNLVWWRWKWVEIRADVPFSAEDKENSDDSQIALNWWAKICLFYFCFFNFLHPNIFHFSRKNPPQSSNNFHFDGFCASFLPEWKSKSNHKATKNIFFLKKFNIEIYILFIQFFCNFLSFETFFILLQHFNSQLFLTIVIFQCETGWPQYKKKMSTRWFLKMRRVWKKMLFV